MKNEFHDLIEQNQNHHFHTMFIDDAKNMMGLDDLWHCLLKNKQLRYTSFHIKPNRRYLLFPMKNMLKFI